MSEAAGALARWRKILFRSGLISCVFSIAGATVCWTSPFPLIPWGNGGYRTNPLDHYFLMGAVCASTLTVLFALFGRGRPRFLLIGSGLLLLAFSFYGFMAGHV